MPECRKCGALLDVEPSSEVSELLCQACAGAEAWLIDLRDRPVAAKQRRLEDQPSS